MRIGIEMRLVTLGEAGGIAMLLRGVLRSLFERHPQHEFICFHTVFNRALLGKLPPHVQQHTLTLGNYFGELGRHCAEKGIDVLFRGYPLEQDVDFPMARQVVEIPDLQHECFPEFFDAAVLRSRRAAFGRVLGEAGAIGTISDFARKTLLEQPGTRCRDIFLMCPALQSEHSHCEPLSAAEESLIPKGDFLLFPANLWKHKNHDRVLQAFDRCLRHLQPSKGKGVTLILTGHPSGWDTLQKRFSHLPISHLGFVRPALLRALYERARALVFFSLYEGFGIPLLEAFDAGTPVLCSNTTSLPEVGDDAVLSCDPTDIEAMAGLMTRMLRERELRPVLANRGRQRLQAYSWEQSADNLIAACLRVNERAIAAAVPPLERIDVKDWPRVALVTPSFNQGRFIKRTIDSVLSQRYPRIDYLVVDGGSTDETLDVLCSYGDRIRWVSEPDRGQTHAINKGLAHLRGDVQAYLNSDDILLPGAIEKAVNYLVAHPQCDLVYGKGHFIDEQDRIIGDYNTADYSFERMMAECCISQPAAFWRTAIAEKVGPFDESLHLAMDYDYWLRIDRAGGKIVHLREFLASTRLHEAAKTFAQRTGVFHETIHVCKKNAGFAALVYYQGYWHYRYCEQSPWRWLLKRIPCLPHAVGRLHHGWDNRKTLGAGPFVRETAMAVKRRIGRRLRPLNRVLNPLRVRRLLNGGRRRAVTGFWGDNWMGRNCVVRLKDNSAGREYHLAGTAIEPMELSVSLNGKSIGAYPLRGHGRETVTIHVEPGCGQELRLRFSKHMVDAAGRELSFMIEDTNLFSEQELATA